jgi:hypothetical protein
MISNETLQQLFITPNIRYYLHKKLAPIAPSEIDIRTEELLKYLNMSRHCNGDIAFNEAIDEVWHLWILETQEYYTLCQKINGTQNSYIHHSSSDYLAFSNPEIKSKLLDADRLFNILLSYVHNYGPFTAERVVYWPLALSIMQSSHWSIDQFNAWLHTIINEQSSLCA